MNETDYVGRATVRRPRVASLLPSTTEIVAALGRIDDLVAVTFECDFPLGVRAGRDIAVNTAMPHGLTPGEIDEFVRARMAANLPMYELDADVMSALGPDVVLTQDLCRVCALPAGEVDAALQRIGCDAEIITFDPHSVDEVFDGIVQIANAIGADFEGQELVGALRTRRDTVRARRANGPHPRVLVLEWIDPPFIAGHWVPELITTAGGEALLARPGERSTTIEWAEAEACKPDIVIVAPCGFGLDEAVAQARPFSDRFPGAVLWAIDGNAYVTRPGPRLVDAIEALENAIYLGLETTGVTSRVC